MRQKATKVFSLMLVVIFLSAFASTTQAQKTVDKMIATVSNGAVKPDLITYSDVLWQIALEPDTSVDNPSSEDLNRALQTIINLKLIEQEAKKLPAITPTDEEIKAEIERTVGFFSSTKEFQRRLNAIGFTSTSDENFRALIAVRVSINKYLDFRFRSFVVITPKEEEDYYNAVFLPRFREQNPGRIVPTLEQSRDEINKELTENKITSDLDKFLESARERAEIVILNPL
jgi:hypothetical protein